MKKITAKQAKRIAEKIGIELFDEQKTFYATNENETEIYEFDTKKERDALCK